MQYTYPIHLVAEYINWSYFFHTWQLGARFAGIAQLHGCDACRAQWLASFPEAERPKAAEAMQLFKEAQRMLQELDVDYKVYGLTQLHRVVSEGDDLWIEPTEKDSIGEDVNSATPFLQSQATRFPFLRQQTPRDATSPLLCLTDFIRPASLGEPDVVGLFAASVDPEIEKLYPNDPYKHLLAQTLADRLAEAAAEKMHLDVRCQQWGYALEEQLSIAELWSEKYRGTRPAVGYPSMPDQSVIFLINDLLPLSHISIQLTTSGAMLPHASVCGLMFAHPASTYFNIGPINEEQFQDYAARRNISAEKLRPFLAANL